MNHQILNVIAAYQNLESSSFDDQQKILICWFDATLIWYIAVVIKQRSQIDPDAARLQNSGEKYYKITNKVFGERLETSECEKSN